MSLENPTQLSCAKLSRNQFGFFFKSGQGTRWPIRTHSSLRDLAAIESIRQAKCVNARPLFIPLFILDREIDLD